MLLLPDRSAPLSVILKLPGDTCNINCFYCYEKRKPYEGAAKIRPEMIGRLMQIAAAHPLAIELHGGEPLIVGRSYLTEVFGQLRAHPGPIKVSMQTNGTLLDRAWLEFFDTEWPELEIGISLDGDPAANNFRLDYASRPTASKVEQALRLVADHGRSVGLIAVVTSASLGRGADIIRYFARWPAIRGLNFAPCFDYRATPRRIPKGNARVLLPLLTGADVPAWAITPMQYVSFLQEVTGVWIEEEHYRRFTIEPVTSVLQRLAGRSPRSCHFSEKKCAHTLTMYPDGTLGSCDELGMPMARLANIADIEDFDELLTLSTNRDLHGRLEQVLQKCVTCAYRDTCGGGCLATRIRYIDTPLYEEYCDYRIALIDYLKEMTGATTREPQGAAYSGDRRVP